MRLLALLFLVYAVLAVLSHYQKVTLDKEIKQYFKERRNRDG